MILLIGSGSSAGDSLQVVTASSVVNIDMHCSYMDYASGTVTPGASNNVISSATTTSVAAAQSSGTQRNVKTLIIKNTHATSSNLVTVQILTIAATTVVLFAYTLLAGETLSYFDELGFRVNDVNGNEKVTQSSQPGRYLGSFVHTSGTTYTTGASTNTIKIRMQAGGGQGGGGLGGSSTASAGAGGAAGGYAEKTFTVTPSTGYTYAIGAGGSTSTGQSTGQVGGNSTFAVGATTVTANGGPGGLGGGTAAATVLTVLGGAPPAISTSGDVNGSGTAGSPGMRLSGTIAVSGKGGDSVFGAGGNEVNTDVAGNAAIGFGAGGGGACSLTANARNGGAGTGGIIIVDEFS